MMGGGVEMPHQGGDDMTTEAAGLEDNQQGTSAGAVSKRRILVGSDGSRKSLEAVRWAINEAQVHGGTVRVIVSWDVREVRMGPAGGVLVRESADADLLVVGSHGLGHGQLPGWHLGSVAAYCVHHAKCPTVVVRN